MKSTLSQLSLTMVILAIWSSLAKYGAADSILAQRAMPIVANGNFEQGSLRPAWTPSITGKANIKLVKQPSNATNHVARVTLHCNPCFCEDDQCCDASLAGTIVNVIANSSYSITWNFMYALNVGDVYWLGDAYHCDQNNCFTSSFDNVQYPKTAKAHKWYTYSASFIAPSNANDGRLSLDIFPGGCKTGHTFMDNFRVYGPF